MLCLCRTSKPCPTLLSDGEIVGDFRDDRTNEIMERERAIHGGREERDTCHNCRLTTAAHITIKTPPPPVTVLESPSSSAAHYPIPRRAEPYPRGCAEEITQTHAWHLLGRGRAHTRPTSGRRRRRRRRSDFIHAGHCRHSPARVGVWVA